MNVSQIVQGEHESYNLYNNLDGNVFYVILKFRCLNLKLVYILFLSWAMVSLPSFPLEHLQVLTIWINHTGLYQMILYWQSGLLCGSEQECDCHDSDVWMPHLNAIVFTYNLIRTGEDCMVDCMILA